MEVQVNITNDQQAFEYLKQLAADKAINLSGAKAATEITTQIRK